MTCRACLAAWGEMPDEACRNHSEKVIELAIAMGRSDPPDLFHSELERAGWFMEDAEIGIDAGVTPPYDVRFKHGKRWTNIYINDHWFRFDHNAEGFNQMAFVGLKPAALAPSETQP